MLYLKLGVILLLAFIGMVVFDYGLSLLNKPSDMAVLAGVLMMIGYILVAVFICRTSFRAIKKKIDSIDSTKFSAVIAVLVLAGSSLFTTGCNTIIPPGHVGILVNQTGADRGVQDFPIQTGRVWYNGWTETVLSYPISVQRVIWTASIHEGKEKDKNGDAVNEEISYNSKDEMVFKGDFTCSYELVGDKVPHFYVHFRNDDIEAFTHGFFRDQVRDALNEIGVQYTADELYGEKKTEFLKKAEENVKSRVDTFGVHVISLGYASSPRPPEKVTEAINAKITAIQRASQTENELRQTKAEAQKVVEKARGEAESNRVLTASITPQLIQWRQLQVSEQYIARWDGKRAMVEGGGGSNMLFQVPLQPK